MKKFTFLFGFLIILTVFGVVGGSDVLAAKSTELTFDCKINNDKKLDVEEGHACGVNSTDANPIPVTCGSKLVCSSNEFNSCQTRVCLTPVGGECFNDKNCEGGSFCDPQAKRCVTTAENEQATTADLRDTIRRAINIVLGFLGIITVILVLYGGFTWLTAAGNEDSVKKGRDILLWATIGAIIISIAWTISSYILNVANKVA